MADPRRIACALMCAAAIAACTGPCAGHASARSLPADGAAHSAGVVGEDFAPAEDPVAAAARKKAARDARDARWHALEESLRKADEETLWERGQEQDKSQNWKDAQEAYEGLVVFFPHDAHAPVAVERALRMAFRRGEYGEGFRFFEDALGAYDAPADVVTRARLLRVLASTRLAVPHWGTTRGGEFLRGRYDQGKQTQTYAEDRAAAVADLEEARELLAHETAVKGSERAAVDIDLALAVARFTAFDATWGWWWAPDNGPDDGLADAEGDDEHAGEWRNTSWSAALQQARPRGLPVSPQGAVLFADKPSAYAPALGDTEKIKFLLAEAQSVDDDANKETAAQALLQQALLFRTRDGGERLDRLRSWWWRGSYPYKDAAKDEEMFRLGDDEVITLVATGVRRVTVPADESVPRLLARVQSLYPHAKAADEAEALLGTYFQSRQQYPRAVAAYESYLKEHKGGAHEGQVRASLNGIRRPEVVFQSKGAQSAGKPAVVSVRLRNLRGIDFTATRIDAQRVLSDFEKRWKNGSRRRGDNGAIDPNNLGWAFVQANETNKSSRYLTKDVVTFAAVVHPNPSFRYAEATLPTPLSKAGVWLVEAREKGKPDVLSRTLVVVDDAAVVLKKTARGTVAWVVDAESGKPIPGASLDVFFYGSRWVDDHEVRLSKQVALTSDEHGLALLPKNAELNAMVSVRVGDAFTMPVDEWLGDNYSPTATGEDEEVAVVVTDRPVYRPGDTVQLKVWARHKKKGAYEPATGVKRMRTRIYDSRGAQVIDDEQAAGPWGSAALRLPLKKGAPLGAYRLEVLVDGRYADTGGATFRVEEYKAPEVQVTVKAAGQARLGDKVPVEVHADYYSGGPVHGAKVHYKIFRRDHEVTYAAPTPWDWLYGPGYGRIWYPYSWFPWWDDCGPHPIFWYPWWGPKPEPPKELVLEGEGVTDDKGVLAVVVDTTAAAHDLGDRDHEYSVEAEVTDLSRHVVKGSGAVTVTRTAFLASLELEAGWARAGDDVSMLVSTLLPDGSLVPVQGTLRVEEILGVTENGAVRGEKIVEEKPLATDDKGATRLRWRAPKTGQYRFTFFARDKDGREVRSSAVAWVVGPDFTGNTYRFAGVEVIPDKRTYAPGDTARLLVSADRAGASVLLATKVDSGTLLDWRVIDLPKDGKSEVIEVPVTAANVPNFFVEATTVAGAQVFEEARELFVPPTASDLRISVKPAAAVVKPGGKSELVVTTTDGQGKPVAAEVALTVFDASVLAIAPDATVDVRKHLWGRKRWHQPSATSSLGRAQAVWGGATAPDQQARWQLQSRAQRRFQRQIDFVHAEGGEATALLADEALDGLAANGVGFGGGGRAKSAETRRAREGEAEGAARADAPATSVSTDMKDADDRQSEKKAPSGHAARDEADTGASAGGPAPHVRTQFADTALFTSVVTGADGTARVPVTFPENLTTWSVRAVGIDQGARVGRGDASIVTTKDLLVRLAAPRFFRDRDRVTLSAIVQNKRAAAERVKVSLDVSDDLLSVAGARQRDVSVPAGGEVRVDFSVSVRGEGQAKVRVTAKGAHDGDAKELTFPVLVHGMEKMVARTGSISAGAGASADKSVEVEVPKERREDQTELVVRTSPSLAGGMIDALPYLLDYPYGCVEQTLSRFVPAVLTRRALQQSGGVTLEGLAKAHRDLDAQHKGGAADSKRNEREHRQLDRNPIYDSALLADIIDRGMTRIRKMQHGDGGWGWWADDESSVYMTSLVLAGLLDAKGADLAVDGDMLARGRSALRREVEAEIWRYKRDEDKRWVNDADAYALWVMSRFGDTHEELLNLLYERRIQLTPYGKLLLALAEKNLKHEGNASLLLQNVDQLRKEDPEDETAYVETATAGWWYWYNDDIETNALYLRALDAIRPGDPAAPQVVKWLLNHRKHGFYWDSTRDTAQVVAAFANHMQVSGERHPDYDLEILVDGAVKKKVHVDAKNMFLVDGDLRLHGKEIGGGKHTITVRRTGQGAVYFNAYLSFFTLEDDIKAAGLEVKVDRRYYKLVRHDRLHDVAGARGQSLSQREVAYEKVPLRSGAQVNSGDLILVELTLTSKNDYTYLAFEDPKPAGAEAVALRSGTVGGEAWAHMELRDDRVVFFLNELTQGKLLLSYRLRAELPGAFSAMPATGFAMYAPEIKANSDEMKLGITEDTGM